ncbi:hypothetical protein, conserved [Angomonas deanei]|uniref:DUF7623 domain-containing protein n=1 Tax=Angomonas deanei TaxID=59799 RepID=A0A7G2C0B6_9TRYP|nr:hypothetical protein, conserved [Angomonas deanei]
MQELITTKVAPERCRHFRSEWNDTNNGGNPSLTSWRHNPIYKVENPSAAPVTLYTTIEQKDQRHLLHCSPESETNYVCAGLALVKSLCGIPTYLLTLNNHSIVANGKYSSTREVTEKLTLPPKSLCYVVPSTLRQEQCPFLLAYTASTPVAIERLLLDVDRSLPAIANLKLPLRSQERVDFVVEAATPVHILLRQQLPFKLQTGGDLSTQDCLAMYLFDAKGNKLAGTSSATNYREIGVVHVLAAPGPYSVMISYPLGSNAEAPCRVEIVATRSARVKITESSYNIPPLYAEEQGAIERAVQPPVIESAVRPTSARSLRTESDFTSNRETPAPEEVVQPETVKVATPPREKSPVKPAPVPTPTPPAPSDRAYSPSNASETPTRNGTSRLSDRDTTAPSSTGTCSFLPRQINGIPIELFHLSEDIPFQELQDAYRKALRDGNTERAKDLKEAVLKRALDVADARLFEVRETFSDIAGFDISTLPLQNSTAYHDQERQLFEASAGDARKNIKQINNIEEEAKNVLMQMLLDEIGFSDDEAKSPGTQERLRNILQKDEEFINLANQRANAHRNKDDDELRRLEQMMLDRAKMLRARRDLLSNTPAIDPSQLSLDNDRQFVHLEQQRAVLLRQTGDHSAEVKMIEDSMERRAFDLAKEQGLLPDDAVYISPSEKQVNLRPIPGVDMSKLPLDKDPEFMRLAKQRADLLSKPGDHSAEIKAIEDAMNRRAFELAKELGLLPRDAVYAGDLTSCLRPIPGVDMSKLPLDKDPEFMRLAKQRADLLSKPGDHSAEIKAIEEAMNRRAFELAKELGLLPRDAVYAGDLTSCLRPIPGVDMSKLPLDKDPEFMRLAKQRADLLSKPGDHSAEIKAIEEAMNRRAFELAKELGLLPRDAVYAGDLTSCLRPIPGVDMSKLPLDKDPEFMRLAKQRADLLSKPGDHSAEIKAIEER